MHIFLQKITFFDSVLGNNLKDKKVIVDNFFCLET